MKYLLLFITILFLLTACVGKKKFTTEYDARRLAETREALLRQELDSARIQVTGLIQQLAERSRQIGSLEYVNGQLTTENKDLKGRIATLSNTSSSQIQALQKNLEERSAALARKEQIFNDLQKTVKERSESLQTLYAKVDTVMQFYRTDGIKVEYREDQQVIVIPTLRLFDLNTARLNTNGLQVIQRFLPLLGNNPNLAVTVEGHTDNSRPKNKTFPDNWALSAAQALAVARVLTRGADLNANQVAPVGRSEYLPRASNDTREGRAQNQRVEIILAPKTASLLRLMERKLSGG
jgi:chemotaxis protein MotB